MKRGSQKRNHKELPDDVASEYGVPEAKCRKSSPKERMNNIVPNTAERSKKAAEFAKVKLH